MSRRVPVSVASVFAILVLLVSGCAAPTPQVVTQVQTQIVKEVVTGEPQVITKVETQVVTKVATQVVTAVPQPVKPQGKLTVALPTPVNTLDPFNYPDINTFSVIHHVCETLIYQNDDLSPAPGLVESWENLDATTWRLRLRKDVSFTNGEPFNAEVVIYSWHYGQSPEVLQKWGYASVAEMLAEDAYTLKVTTKEPDPLFLQRLMSMGFVVPPKYIEEKGKAYFAEHPIGTGPFVLKEWVKGDHVTLEANPNYWLQGVPKLAELTFMVIPEVSSRVAALQAGQIDLASRVESQYIEDLTFDPQFKVVRYSVPRVFYFGFNTVNLGKDTPIANEKVRQALAYSLDTKALTEKIMEGEAVQVNSLVGNHDTGHDDTLEPFPYDIVKAKELLAEAGYPDGFEINMGGPADAFARGKEVCEAAVGMWKQVGVQVNLQMIESGKYWDDAAQRKYPPIFFDSWSTVVGDAQERLEGMLLENGSYANFYDAELADLVTQAGATVDAGERNAVYAQIQRMIQQKVPAIGLYEPYGYQALSAKVDNYVPRGPETLWLQYVSVRE